MTHAGARRLPVTLRVSDRRVVVVGGDSEGLGIARLLVEFGARVVVIADAVEPSAEDDSAGFEIVHRGYVRGDLREAFVAVCTEGDRELRGAVRAEADAIGCPLYVVGAAELSDFVFDADELTGRFGTGEST